MKAPSSQRSSASQASALASSCLKKRRGVRALSLPSLLAQGPPFRRGSLAGGVSVVVDGLNIAKKHTKPRQGSSSGVGGGVPKIEPGGILEVALPMPISKVMLVCPNCHKPTRIGHATLDAGRRVRVCRHCGQQLEVKA